MSEDNELAQIKKKKLEELMRRQREVLAPKPPTIIEVFTSPTCPHCPRALAMAKQLAAQVPGIQVVEQSTATSQGYAKAALYKVQAVPTVFINGKRAFVGAPPSVGALRDAVKSYSSSP
ncbi:MAG: thioredoxin family protein [Candidatus Methanoperedens sp.]|nr:thioredoxin family protein [Candidatus Methanoperedens sp.]